MPRAAELRKPDFMCPRNAADIVVFMKIDGQDALKEWEGWAEERPHQRTKTPTRTGIHVLTIGRHNPPFPHEEGYRCLPGGFIDYGEDPKHAAARELEEETHIPRDVVLERLAQMLCFGSPERDPRVHVISHPYWIILTPEEARQAYGGDDAKWVEWTPTGDVWTNAVEMGFDHRDIVLAAVQQMRAEIGA